MIKILLYPLSIVYGIVVYLRNAFYDYKLLKSTEFDIPLISVGNITVGGTGKTPHTEYLIELLKKHGVNVVTLSRGYKRKTKGFRLVESTSDVYHVGDEPLQIKRKFPDITVAVDENRVRGINILLRQTGNKPDVVLLDDAFQHRKVTPGVNILLIDHSRPLEQDHLLPLGRLRERAYQKRRANVIIYTKCPHEITPISRRIIMKDLSIKPYQSLYFTTMEYGEPIAVFQDEAIPMPDFDEEKISAILIAGIANPDPLSNYLATRVKVVEELIFSDHHAYKQADIKRIIKAYSDHKQGSTFILTTEKDAMRLGRETGLPNEVKSRLYYIPVKVVFLQSEGKSFNKKIVGYVKDNRSNRALHSLHH